MGLTKRQVAEKVCRRYPDMPARTLARKLHEDNPALFPTIEDARRSVRVVFGVCGKRYRKQTAKLGTARPPRKAGAVPPLPESVDEPWEPFVLNAKRILVLSDLHLPYHSVGAIDAAIAYGIPYLPDAILINGDLFDFYQLSRFDKSPTKPKVAHELECGNKFFAHLRGVFGNGVRVILKLGNHDQRWDTYLQQAAPLLFDIPAVRNGWHELAGIDTHGIEVVSDQRPIMLGRLPVLHGHELGRGISSPVNPARGAFLRAHHTILVGHSHQTSGHADTNIWHEETFCWSTGCLCGLTPEYARINRWNYGFATVTVAKDGSFDVENLRITQDFKVRKS